MSRLPHGLVAAVFAALVGCQPGCSCGSPATEVCEGVVGVQAGHLAACTQDAECADHFACQQVDDGTPSRAPRSCCVFVDRVCATEADCCPGQTCPAARLRCLDKVDACTADEDCGAAGDRFCETYTDTYGTSRRCRLRACDAQGRCPEGQACFQGACVAGLPCDGRCEPGQACVPTIDRCQDYRAPAGRPDATCPVSCPPGAIATFADARNLWDTCDLPLVACVCAELPPLRVHDLGRFSAITAEAGKAVHVSAYDGQHGDLVVASFDLDGGALGAAWVDGVPDGAVTWGSSGPRGGVEAPGPDVGRATDIAAAGGRLFVSYRDVSQADLKVAMRDEAGRWTTHTVDGASGDVGLFSSIAVDTSGRPWVAYFQRSFSDAAALTACPTPRPPASAARYVTALKLAHATTPTPHGAGDWAVQTLSCLAVPAPGCEGCAGTCTMVGSAPTCLPGSAACAACAAPKVCVELDGGPSCLTRASAKSLQEVPLGVGVFAALALRGDEALVVAMRRAVSDGGAAPKGELVGFTVVGEAAPSAVVLDASGDTGYFPRLAVEPGGGRVAVAYHDFTSRAFKLYVADGLRAGVVPELIDDGKDATGIEAYVGTGSALVFTPDAGLLALYQDATHGDLKRARRAGTWAVDGPVSQDGAVGFFADAVLVDGTIFVSHARLRARATQPSLRLETSLLLDRVSP